MAIAAPVPVELKVDLVEVELPEDELATFEETDGIEKLLAPTPFDAPPGGTTLEGPPDALGRAGDEAAIPVPEPVAPGAAGAEGAAPPSVPVGSIGSDVAPGAAGPVPVAPGTAGALDL